VCPKIDSLIQRKGQCRQVSRLMWVVWTHGVEGNGLAVASYTVNQAAVARARELIEARQYVLDSDWREAQPRADDENRYLESHSWDEYARWFLGLTDGATDGTKARYAFVYGDLRRIHRSGIIACLYRAAEWRHKDVERAAYDLLQRLDEKAA
jgi:hypothetical protein